MPSRKKDDSGKSGRKVEIKKNFFKQKGRQSQLSMQLGKVHKKPDLAKLKNCQNHHEKLKFDVGLTCCVFFRRNPECCVVFFLPEIL